MHMMVSKESLFIFTIYCCSIASSHVAYQRAASHLEHHTASAKILEKHENKIVPAKSNTNAVKKTTDIIEKCDTCPGGAECVPHVQCPAHVRMRSRPPACHLSHGRDGICCSTGQNHTTKEDLKARASFSFDSQSLKEAIAKSKLRMARLIEKEHEILDNPKFSTLISRGTPTFGHFQSMRSANQALSSSVGMNALNNLFAMQALKERQSISNEDVSLGLGNIIMEDTNCPPPPKCEHIHIKYRSIDGACNNPLHPTWGAAMTATERLLPPNYDDGIWSPRMSASDRDGHLKSPRAVSAHLLPDRDRPHQSATLLTMQFGQFLAHDMSSSVGLTLINGSAISCCTEDGTATLPPDLSHFACYPIEISAKDDFYSKFKQRCMNFVRTQLAPNHDCSLGYAKQMNGVTHYLDLSQMYGSDPMALSPLREWSGGRLKMFNDFGRDLLPLSNDKNDCITMEQGSACFKSGDGHANQMITLVAVHTIFNREHNRIAALLSMINPHWSEQLIFLEARRILIGELQHIVYNEWLPTIIGNNAMDEFDLKTQKNGKYSMAYDEHVNPSLTNEFGVAAFRFGHSNVDGKLKIPKDSELDEIISIPEVMFHPSRMRVKEFFDRILNCLTSQPMQDTDPSMSKMLTKYLFRGGSPFGIDLASLNIQRGRDHGLRSYNDYRELVGLTKIESFQEFGSKVSEHLAHVYASPDDIDLWVGGLLEAPEMDAVVGYTFKEIIGDQFSRLKKGDRYFYDYGPETNPGHFTPTQLAEIQKSSMSRLICDNSDHIELHFQSPNAFVRPDVPGNEPIPCISQIISSLDLTAWKEF